MKKRFMAVFLCSLLAASLTGCSYKGIDSLKDLTDLASVSSGETTIEETEESTDDLFSNSDYDTSYDDYKTITLSDNASSSDSKNVDVDDNVININSAGTYLISGSLSDGQIVVDAENEKVRLVLNGVDISNSTGACIYVKEADKVFITSAEGSENSLSSDGEFVQTDDNNIDATIFSKADLTLNGEGSLSVICKNEHAIVSKDDLVITSGTYTISASEGKGLQGKDSVRIGGGDITVTDSYEGIEGLEIYIADGDIDITSSDDGINAVNKDSDDETAKMAGDDSCKLVISGGSVNINAGGDGIDSNGSVTVTGGETYVSGATNGGNAAMDYGTGASISGGIFVATGFSQMACNFGEDSTQGAILYTFSETVNGGVAVKLLDADGNEVLSYTPAKEYNSVLISSPEIKAGSDYTITAGNLSETITMESLIYGGGQGFGMGGGFGGHNGEMKGALGDPGGENFDPDNLPEGFENITPGVMPDGIPEGEGNMPGGGAMPGGGKERRGGNGGEKTAPSDGSSL
jgi:hypothetical protein